MTFDSLPFGWNLSPIIAQTVLARILQDFLLQCSPLPEDDFHHFHYLDDVLFLAHTPTRLQRYAHAFAAFLSSAGLLLSKKSSLQPAQHITWLGKQFNLLARTITPTCATSLRTIALICLGSLRCLSYKSRLRLAGNILWTARPIPGSTLFLSGLYRPTTDAGPSYLSNSTLRDLLTFLPFALSGWEAAPFDPSPGPDMSTCFFADAAQTYRGNYQVGIFHSRKGVQVVTAPAWVTNQQVAEAWALEYAIRIIVRRSEQSIALVGDNLGALQNLLSLQPRVTAQALRRVYRRIFHLLQFSRKTLKIYWVPTCLQPADKPSRSPLDTESINAAYYEAFATFQTLQASPCLRWLGNISNCFAPHPTSGVGVL